MIQFPGLIIDLGLGDSFNLVFSKLDVILIITWFYIGCISSELKKIRKILDSNKNLKC